jgi:Transposase IS66 family
MTIMPASRRGFLTSLTGASLAGMAWRSGSNTAGFSCLAQLRSRALDAVVTFVPSDQGFARMVDFTAGTYWRRDVPATNNASERALRPFMTARKVFGCARSKEGADAMAVIRSVLMTARVRGLQVMNALATALAGGILPPGNRVAAA